MKNRYLFIVTESESANGICASNVMDALIKAGEDVHYFTVKQRLVGRIDSYLRHRSLSKVKKKILKMIFWLINKAKLMLSVFSWPLISRQYCQRYYKKAKQIVSDYSIHCIVPIYKQIDPLIVASKLKTLNPQIVVTPYFLDSLSGGFGPKIFSKRQFLKRGLKWEKRVLWNADAVFVMEASRGHHEQYNRDTAFFEKLVYVDIPLLHLQNGDRAEGEATENDKIKVLYCGTLAYPMRNIPYIVEVLSRINSENVEFVFVGNTNVASLFSNAKCVKYLPAMSHDKVVAMMQEADVLMNLGVKQVSAISGKIFEYMAIGKPIISTYCMDEEACFQYLQQYPLTLMLDERDTDYQGQADKIMSFLDSVKGKSVDPKYVLERFEANRPETFVKNIQRVIERKNEDSIN